MLKKIFNFIKKIFIKKNTLDIEENKKNKSKEDTADDIYPLW